MKEETKLLTNNTLNATNNTIISPAIRSVSPSPNLAPNSTSVGAWPCTANQYEQGGFIHNGKFSTVLTGICKTNQQRICIKIMDLESFNLSFEKILQEIQFMRLCNDPNILTCFINFVHKEQLWLITQLMDKGSCLRVMKISEALAFGEGFSEDCLAYILAETLKGLNYLHTRSLIHRDVKSGNILLDSIGGVKLSDLALSGVMAIEAGQRTQKAKTCIGTLFYMAPEVLEQSQSPGGYDHRADIWSLGITTLELAKGYAPYADISEPKMISLMIENDPPSLKSYPYDKQLSSNGPSFSKHYEDFYKQCLQKNPKHRPSAAELLKHRLIRSSSADSLIQFLQKIPNIDDTETNDAILKANRQNQNHHNHPSTVTEVLDDFALTASVETMTSTLQPLKKEGEGGGKLNNEEELQTPSRFNSKNSRTDYVDNFPDASTSRSRSASLQFPLSDSQSDHQHSSSTTRSNSVDNNSRKFVLPESVEEFNPMNNGSDEKDEENTAASSYVPGTTWVFDTSVRGEDGSFKSLQGEHDPNEELSSTNIPAEVASDKDKAAISDFLDDFEEEEATIKSKL